MINYWRLLVRAGVGKDFKSKLSASCVDLHSKSGFSGVYFATCLDAKDNLYGRPTKQVGFLIIITLLNSNKIKRC